MTLGLSPEAPESASLAGVLFTTQPGPGRPSADRLPGLSEEARQGCDLTSCLSPSEGEELRGVAHHS